jgi:hypothetical protein
MGRQNVEITNGWGDVVRDLNRFPALHRFVPQATNLRDQFSVIKEDMRRLAMDMRRFSDQYNNIYFRFFLSMSHPFFALEANFGKRESPNLLCSCIFSNQSKFNLHCETRPNDYFCPSQSLTYH